MPKPRKPRRLRFKPEVRYFKPKGVPLRDLNEEVLEGDEIEALKLHDVDGLEHMEAARQMNVSQPTFGRILNSAYKKMAKALVLGRAIRVEE